jgi:uncharacterized protein YjiS (DUF1127 family)
MFDRIRALRARARSIADVQALSDRELADLGMGRDQAVKLAAAPADTVDRMARIFAVDPELLHRDRGTMMALAETCADCGARDTCAATLALETALPGSVAASDCGFCANAADYRMLRRPA